MTLSLYEIANEFKSLEQKLLQAFKSTKGDADYNAQTIADTLESEAGALEAKSINVAMVIRNLEASAEQIKQAEKQMAERRKALENKAESIKQYLFDNMKRCGISKIESPYFNLTIKKNPPKLIVDDASLIPKEYFIQPPLPEPYLDNETVKAKLLEGVEIEGAHIEQGERLDIK